MVSSTTFGPRRGWAGRWRALSSLPGPPLWSLPRLGLVGARRPHELAEALHRRYGNVVRLGVGPSSYVYLFGEAANRRVLVDEPGSFTWREALRPLAPVVGPTALVLTDGEEHRCRRRVVQPAFATRRIDAAVPTLVAEIDRMIDSLPVGQPVDLYDRYRAAVRRIVVRVLFGEAPDGLADRIGDALEPAMRFVDRPAEFQLPMTGAWYRSRRARRQAEELVTAEMSRRRSDNRLGADVMGVLLATELSDDEVRDQVVSLIAAGYETTAAAVGWVVLELLRHPEEWQRCQQEVRQVLGDSAPTADQLRALPTVTTVINETLRLWPPAVLGRRASTTFTYDGHEIPAGAIVLISPYVTHRATESWGPDAAQFRPSRWQTAEPATEHFFPFGGTHRRCLGFALALTEIQVALVRLLQRTTMTSATVNVVRGHGLSALRPDGGVPVIIHAIKPGTRQALA